LTTREAEARTLSDRARDAEARLELAELNLRQLRSAADRQEIGQTNETLKESLERETVALRDENKALKDRETELAAYIQQASQDREQIIQQYTAYCKQLTAQVS